MNRYQLGNKFNWRRAYISCFAKKPFIGKHKFSDLLNTPIDVKCLPDETFINRFRRKTSEDIPPQFYTIAISDDYNINGSCCQLMLKNGKIKTVSARSASHRFSRTLGPRMFFLIEAYVDYEWIVPTLYSHPIVSLKTPILVDSDEERKFFQLSARKLEAYKISQTNKLQERSADSGEIENIPEVNYTIEKPYFAKVFTDKPNVPLIPDFKLTVTENYGKKRYKRDLLVEVMGIDSAEYNARKAKIIPSMKSRWGIDVAKVKPATMEQDFNALMNMEWSSFNKK